MAKISEFRGTGHSNEELCMESFSDRRRLSRDQNEMRTGTVGIARRRTFLAEGRTSLNFPRWERTGKPAWLVWNKPEILDEAGKVAGQDRKTSGGSF